MMDPILVSRVSCHYSFPTTKIWAEKPIDFFGRTFLLFDISDNPTKYKRTVDSIHLAISETVTADSNYTPRRFHRLYGDRDCDYEERTTGTIRDGPSPSVLKP